MIFSQIKALDIKFKVGIAFSLGALFISFVLGFVSGNGAATVIARSFILAIVFFIIGYLFVLVIQKYVPEFNTVLNRNAGAVNGEMDSDENNEFDSNDAGGMEAGQSDIEAGGPGGEEEEFVPSQSADYPEVGSTGVPGSEIGKHFIVGENKIKYEPKIMADAIRTMLKKDEKA